MAEIETWSNTKKNDITTVLGGDLNTGKVAVGTKVESNILENLFVLRI